MSQPDKTVENDGGDVRGLYMREEAIDEEKPTNPGRYEYLRVTGTYRPIAGYEGDGDICRHIDRPRKMTAVSYPGVAARCLPQLHIGLCCQRCHEDMFDSIDEGNAPVWESDRVPIVGVSQ